MANHAAQLIVSVVVCIYNGEKTLAACIESLLTQAYPREAYEIIFVDDGSRDDSAEICRQVLSQRTGQLPRLSYVFQTNRGLGAARNTGIYLAKGQVVAFIDQDAVADVNWLSEIQKPFADEQVGVVGGRIDILNRESAMARFVDVVRYHQYFDPAHMPAVIGANMAYRKAVLDQRGGFYNEFTHRGDETSLVRRLSAYCRSARAPAAIVYHERPSSWRRWLRTEFQEGYLMPLIAKAPTAQSRSREWLAWLEKLGVALAPIWLLLAVCSRAWCRLLGLVGAAVSMLGLARRHFFVGHYRQIRQRLRREYSFPLVGVVYVGVDWLMTAARTCGWLYGLWTYRRASLSLAFPSGASIERLLTNQPNKTES